MNFENIVISSPDNDRFLNFVPNVISLGRQDLVTQILVKMTFLYKLLAKKLDFVLSKLQISIWKDRETVAW